MGNSSTKASKLSSDSDKYETPHGSPSLKFKVTCPSAQETDSTGKVDDSLRTGNSSEPVLFTAENEILSADNPPCDTKFKNRMKDSSRKLERPRSLLSVPAFLRLGVHKSNSLKGSETRSVPTSAQQTPELGRTARLALVRPEDTRQKLNETILVSPPSIHVEGDVNCTSSIRLAEDAVRGQDASDMSSASSTGSGFIFIVDSAAQSSPLSVSNLKYSQEKINSSKSYCAPALDATDRNVRDLSGNLEQIEKTIVESPRHCVRPTDTPEKSLTQTGSCASGSTPAARTSPSSPAAEEALDDEVPCFTIPFGSGAGDLYAAASPQMDSEIIAPPAVISDNFIGEEDSHLHQDPETLSHVFGSEFNIVPSHSSPNIQCIKRYQHRLEPTRGKGSENACVLESRNASRLCQSARSCDSENYFIGPMPPIQRNELYGSNFCPPAAGRGWETVCPASLMMPTSRRHIVSSSKSMGRVHSATCSAINPATRTATVEWFEKGDTKGKEVDFDAVFSLNPDLAPQNPGEFKHPGALPKHHPHHLPHTTDADEDEDDQTSTSDGELSDYVAPPPSHSLLGRGPATRASGRLLRNSQSTSNAAQLLRPYGAPQNSLLPSQLPRGPPLSGTGLSAAQVARSQSASRLTMVR
ncbi:hypothetical protein FHG87_001237 [Trinorchestia longiramus]|nr:hypothetical protein FHG87_001237 [Trinorchestia longiramus]